MRRIVLVHGPVVDASTFVSLEKAKAIRAAGYLAIMRCCDFPNEHKSEPTRAEIDGYFEAGLGFALYFMWRSVYGAPIARVDADRRHALIEKLEQPLDTPTVVDYESLVAPSALDTRAYGLEHSARFASYGRTNRGGYWAHSVAHCGADMSGTHDFWVESGERPYGNVWKPRRYAMRQRPNPPNARAVFVAGHPVDLNDCDGMPFAMEL